MKVTLASIADYATDISAVQTFCEKKGLADYAPLAVDLVKECIKLVDQPRLSVDINDDSGEEFLLLEFTVQSGGEPFRGDYNRLLQRWGQSVPWPQSLMVVFCFAIAS